MVRHDGGERKEGGVEKERLLKPLQDPDLNELEGGAQFPIEHKCREGGVLRMGGQGRDREHRRGSSGRLASSCPKANGS